MASSYESISVVHPTVKDASCFYEILYVLTGNDWRCYVWMVFIRVVTTHVICHLRHRAEVVLSTASGLPTTNAVCNPPVLD